MAALDLRCLTTDPDGTTYYSFSYTGTGSQPPRSEAILIKSNTNPASPANLTWSVVSMIDTVYLTYKDQFYFGEDYTCAVNAQGVFTVFGRYNGLTGPNAVPKIPRGFRYDPAGSMDPSFKFEGPGAWSNITFDPVYNWTGLYDQQVLGYVNNAGTSVLVHAYLSVNSTTVNIARVDEATKMLTSAGVWPLVN